MSLLKNKITIVTGAASGIGKAIVEAILKEDYSVIAADHHQERLAQLAKSTHPYPTPQLHA
jgi:NADP-dependent 3-hydroxy acid dehydrogenase YdfG